MQEETGFKNATLPTCLFWQNIPFILSGVVREGKVAVSVAIMCAKADSYNGHNFFAISCTLEES